MEVVSPIVHQGLRRTHLVQPGTHPADQHSFIVQEGKPESPAVRKRLRPGREMRLQNLKSAFPRQGIYFLEIVTSMQRQSVVRKHAIQGGPSAPQSRLVYFCS
ncbi:MAG: hypothetical protein JJ866_15915 [Roseibium sp.]|uniref:hypothetical protein n=1 Tax=Roseibium sp. TaxID=1936156 RepID=UPI001B156EF2|nr:hypothetical protein [Roseibium sp.]MBO6893430.1 hypothetical protein [Roseibium sp.]MBO6930603.1 hypothetical protein [Roseibium sp.]